MKKWRINDAATWDFLLTEATDVSADDWWSELERLRKWHDNSLRDAVRAMDGRCGADFVWPQEALAQLMSAAAFRKQWAVAFVIGLATWAKE